MNFKDFDDSIRKALDDFQAPAEKNSWERMQELMAQDPELSDEDTDAEVEFDQNVKDKIEKLHASYQPHHWALMAERIRQEFSFREKVVRFKVVEIALVLFTIFTFFQVFPIYQEMQAEKKEAKRSQMIAAQSDFQNTAETASASAQNNISSAATDDFSVVSGTRLSNGHPENLSITADFSAFIGPLNFDQKAFVSQPEKASILNEESNFNFENSLPNTSISGKKIGALDFEPARFGATVAALSKRKKSSLKVSIFSSIDYNYIKTPYDKIFNLQEYGRYAPGYGGGVTMAYSFGKWAVEAGGVYSSKEYQPRIKAERIRLGQSLAWTRFDNIQLNVLEIPLNVRYSPDNTGKWRFYGQTGASLHLALQADYDKFPTVYGRVQGQTLEGNQPKLAKKKYPDGLLEGGNFKENSYFTVNIGIGMERLLSTRWSVFMQPGLQAHIAPYYNNGLGPNQDRISNISILTGARVTIW